MQKIMIGWAMTIGLLLALAGCVGERNELTVPVSVGGGEGVPAVPPATVIQNDDLTNIPGQREVHTAMSRQGCDKMAATFKQQGLRLTLTKKVPAPNPGAKNMTICVFEGEDAIENRFADYRYNSKDEY
jgi:hypothetical protein